MWDNVAWGIIIGFFVLYVVVNAQARYHRRYYYRNTWDWLKPWK